MRLLIALLALLPLGLAAPAYADEPPVPQVFRGVAADKGQWRMEILEGHRGGRPIPGGMQGMTICTDNLLRSRGTGERRAARGRDECKYRVLKDTADEAVMESECPDGTSRMTMTREGAKSVLMQAEHQGKRGDSSMKMRYTYLGACREGQGAMSFDKDSPACQQMRARMGSMDPAAQCAGAGEQRAACEARMRAALEQMSAMCR